MFWNNVFGEANGTEYIRNMDEWIKSERDKNFRTRATIGLNVHHTDEKLKDLKGTMRQTDRIRQRKSQQCRRRCPSYSSTLRIGSENVRILRVVRLTE
jgi:hypothetical protein